ncbi:MAG: Tricarboxylate transport protein TctC [Herminiimonas sp.]|nr:Tricarboxylate transport protein TctC [Herminiimonas sp.]
MRIVRALAVLAISLLALTAAHGQSKFPERPITIVVPFPPGGAVDIMARQVGNSMEKRLGQPVVIMNRPGQNGSIGAASVARAQADGYTILYGTSSTQAANAALYPQLAYNPLRDFTGVAIESDSVHGLFVSPKYKDLSVKELIEKIKQDPREFAFAGSSTTHELMDKQLRDGFKLDHTYVNYRSFATAAADIIGGRLAGGWAQVATGHSYVKSGKLHIVALGAREKMASFPDTPLFSEVLPSMNFIPWTGYFVPAGTPPAVVDILSQAMLAAFKEPATLRLIELGGRPVPYTPKEVEVFVRNEYSKWTDYIKRAGVTPN